MSGGDDWKKRSPLAMLLRLVLVVGLCGVGAIQLGRALLMGVVDWPGRGMHPVTLATHPALFIAAVLGWLFIVCVLARMSLIGSKRLFWIMRNRPDA